MQPTRTRASGRSSSAVTWSSSGSPATSRVAHRAPPRYSESSERSSRARSTMRATSSGVADRALSIASLLAPLPRRGGSGGPGELLDLPEDRGAPAVRDLVRADGVELRRAQALEPVDDLGRGQRVVVGDREVAGRGGGRRGRRLRFGSASRARGNAPSSPPNVPSTASAPSAV